MPAPDRLWSPWRMEYIELDHDDVEGCIFCDRPARGEDEAAFILARGDLAFVMLNAYPYNPGHLMVAPFRHIGDLEEASAEEMASASSLLQRSIAGLKRAIDPDGFNVGINLGRVAGAGIPGHLHWHVVPRWNGDANFMPVIAETRVLPELVAETYVKLKPAFSA
jgi:ATP adenylyltransferase